MGYRHYFYIAERELLKKIGGFSENEFYKWGKEAGLLEEDYGEGDWYLPLYKIGSTYLEFGKYYDNYDEIWKCGKPLFSDEMLQDRYDEYHPYVVGREAVANAIEHQRQIIVKYYEDMLNRSEEGVERLFDSRTNEQVYKDHINSMYREWKEAFGMIQAINVDEKEQEITNSWKYEYSIFEMVRKYKTTDWNKYALIFMGW